MQYIQAVPVSFLLFLLSQGVPAHKGVTQEPAFIMVNEGESVNIICTITMGVLDGMYLSRGVVKAMDVLYVPSNVTKPIRDPHYANRIDSSVLSTEVRITLHRLQKNDTDVYFCNGSVLVHSNPRIVSGQGTILVVKDKLSTKLEQAECQVPSWVTYFISSMALILAFALGYFILSRIDIKKHCQKGKEKHANVVYEDMSYSLRCNTLTTISSYSNCSQALAS